MDEFVNKVTCCNNLPICKLRPLPTSRPLLPFVPVLSHVRPLPDDIVHKSCQVPSIDQFITLLWLTIPPFTPFYPLSSLRYSCTTRSVRCMLASVLSLTFIFSAWPFPILVGPLFMSFSIGFPIGFGHINAIFCPPILCHICGQILTEANNRPPGRKSLRNI